ncbi:HpcH/HpaI aldolase/citrate lyase family protein [Sphingomonas solaris]|uniref:CoA ester lyase n=1 Tax=Alterirhizorhabdus solaris TaxID=2529389 RepID=A0A558QTS8_9SPHN|nr:CoA ester lyase [Sphingomonas solaris]TVV70472.1 CoA ester lyase [Sphingomonas solaris]
MNTIFADVRSALYLPASNARAIEKARGLPCDMVILDLEDAVKPDDKQAAREAAVAAVAEGFGPRIAAIRLNGSDSVWHADDVAAVRASHAAVVVLPKVESAAEATRVADAVGKPLFAMIETPAGVLAAVGIAAAHGVAGLIAGSNDLAATLRLPPDAGRAPLALSLQTIVLAARAAGIVALDGVWNRLADLDGLAEDARAGRATGFDGKTLIHPNHIAPANTAFGPTPAELEDARALVEAATGGAERFRDRMIETMHVDAAKRLIARGER